MRLAQRVSAMISCRAAQVAFPEAPPLGQNEQTDVVADHLSVQHHRLAAGR